jgi:hypothetical protein
VEPTPQSTSTLSQPHPAQGARAARRQGQQGSGQGSDQGSGQAAKACSDMALT